MIQESIKKLWRIETQIGIFHLHHHQFSRRELLPRLFILVARTESVNFLLIFPAIFLVFLSKPTCSSSSKVSFLETPPQRGDQMELWAELSENLWRRSFDLEDPRYSTTAAGDHRQRILRWRRRWKFVIRRFLLLEREQSNGIGKRLAVIYRVWTNWPM